MLRIQRGLPFTFCEWMPWRCTHCGPISTDPEWVVEARQTWESPEEGTLYCGNCGRADACGENEEPTTARVVSRRRIKAHKLEKAA